MNVKSFEKRDYGNNMALLVHKNKPNSKPNKPNLLKAEMNISFFVTKDYENQPLWSLLQNKPNSKPIAQTPEMNVTPVFTKDYQNQPPWGSKANQTQFRNSRSDLRRLPQIQTGRVLNAHSSAEFQQYLVAVFLKSC